METRFRQNKVQPRKLYDGIILYDPKKRAFSAEPVSHVQALTCPSWKAAMDTEYSALMKNNTWRLVPAPPGQHVISCKWIFKLKYKADGTIERHKARLVARGFTQQYGVDYTDTFSPVIKPTTVRLILAIAVSKGWHLRQIDIQNAFLHGDIQEEVYMTQPPGYVDPTQPGYVCRLQKSLYGLKQAPRAWYSKLSMKLQELGFIPSRADTSLFIFTSATVTIYMLIYVDDIIIVGSRQSAVDNLLVQLHVAFAVKDLGTLHYFLGVEVQSISDGIALTQRKYATDLLRRVNMQTCKSVTTPMSSADRLSKDSGVPLAGDDVFLYRSTLGALQ
jgi:histone deacetylase 1/2